MSDIFLSRLTDDIDIDIAGRARLTETVEEDTQQRLRNVLRIFLAEWFLDTRLGVPYFQEILVKNPNLGAIRTAFTSRILRDRAVAGLTAFDVEWDRSTRHLEVNFTAALVTAELLEVTLGLNVQGVDGRVIVLDDGSTLVT